MKIFIALAFLAIGIVFMISEYRNRQRETTDRLSYYRLLIAELKENFESCESLKINPEEWDVSGVVSIEQLWKGIPSCESLKINPEEWDFSNVVSTESILGKRKLMELMERMGKR